ncbi:MAG: hypothetical protein DRJ31_08690 [Candidatus Methanomethylicota archaeon]|uniref:Uncharacterized protein n=1 Tax=Thermoproteota archaeon TaxID=2056631 RepID=A0A497EN44_9CREN|nr:MAG: hypothetical protein DRJ31_08690 [Candidatus Verstraetearchaeota archaeon]
MQMITFLIFLTVNLILGLIGLLKKGMLYGIIGIATCIFVAPLVATQGLVVGYTPTYENGTVVAQTPIYADTSIIVLVMFMLIVIHFISILKAGREI